MSSNLLPSESGTASRSCRSHSLRPSRSITARRAAILALFAGTAALSSASSDETPAANGALLTLPALGNTQAHDRVLMQEIGDEHVFDLTADEALAIDAAQVPAADRSPARTDSSTAADDGDAPLGDKATIDPMLLLGADVDPPATDATPAAREPAAQAAPGPWARIRESDRLPVSDRPEVQAFRSQYEAEALWIDRILARGSVFIEHLVDALDDRYLPVELALLPAIESGYRPDVLSRGQAAGLWQIVPITAREIGIERNAWFDGRSDTITSTTAAIDYLSYLSAEFHGDWELTLAAYNAGPGRVNRAIKRNREAGKPTDFWSLPLPEETRAYVPKLFALVQMVKEDRTLLQVPANGPPSGFEVVDAGLRISLDKAAALADQPEDVLRRLNAGLLHGVTAPDGPHTLYLPSGSAETFLAQLATADRDELFSLPASHEVVAGDTLSGIAHRYGMRQRRLMDLNALDDSRIRIGQTLNVLDRRAADNPTLEYVVTIGDTLSGIARKHSVKRSAIRDAKGAALTSDVIHPGVTLTIQVSLGNSG